MPNSPSKRAQRRDAVQNRIELRKAAKLVLLDDFAREVARQQQLDLTGYRFGIDCTALLATLAIRTQENVFTAIDQDTRLGFVARCDHVDGDQGQQQCEARWNNHPCPLAEQCMPYDTQIDVAKL